MYKTGQFPFRIWRFLSTAAVLHLASLLPGVAQTKELSVVATDVSDTPAAIRLVEKHRNVKEDGFEMRFRVLELVGPDRWKGLDFETRGKPLKVQRVDEGVELLLPNGGTCTIARADSRNEPGYIVRFSSAEVGVPETVPIQGGNVLLLGAPQNNAHNATFVRIVLSEGSK